jgi:hypothetical protein
MHCTASIAGVARRAEPRGDIARDLTFLVLIRRVAPTYRQFTSILRKEASLADEFGEGDDDEFLRSLFPQHEFGFFAELGTLCEGTTL